LEHEVQVEVDLRGEGPELCHHPHDPKAI
jgi:hypothetical protein